MPRTPGADMQACQKISTLDELGSALESLPENVVYRGQTKHHTDPEGRLSMTTSFEREGCIPPLMVKWSQYAESVIRALQGPDQPEPSEGRTQAILQHYGWRSFYIDATNNPAVAAWFASHEFSSTTRAELCEDAFEEGVCLITMAAKYALSAVPTGHLYVISKDEVIRLGAECDDLGEKISTEPGLRLRFLDQEACMLGPFTKGVDERCIVAHFEVPVSVLAQFAKNAGFHQTHTLFPTAAEDPVLRLLLNSPWVRASQDIALPTFVQGLRLPMYSDNYQKHLPAAVALYSREWVDAPGTARRIPELGKALFIRVPDAFAYGQPTGETAFARLSELLRQHGTVVIEFDGLFRYAERSDEQDYYKGIVMVLDGDRLSVAALVVRHPGMRLTASGSERGWYYSVLPDAQWQRLPSLDDCPCNAPHRHEQFFCPIERIECALGEGRGRSIGPLSIEIDL
jgi:FRG domain